MSAWTTAVSVSLVLLFAGLESLEPTPAATVAVFVRLPVALALTTPPIVNVNWLPVPGASARSVKLTVLPAVAFVPHEPVPVTAQLTVRPVIDAGTTSVNENPVASDGPLVVTVIV
jgi:hypothetical protein